MKKVINVLLILGVCILGLQSFQTAYSAEQLKEPFFSGEQLEPAGEEPTTRAGGERSSKKVIVLPEEEVVKIKDIQKKYTESMEVPSVSKFTKNPVLENGVYGLGTFNPVVQQSLSKQLNFYRELANLKTVPLSEADIAFAQHGAIGMAAVRTQTHSLSSIAKPSDMPQSFWTTAGEAAKSSNIHSSVKESSLNFHLDSYITDYGSTNKMAGHRAGIMGLQAVSVGAGYAKASKEGFNSSENFYTTLYTKSDYKGIAGRYADDFITQWPAQNYFPIQLYNRENPYNDDYYKNNKDPVTKSKYEKNMRWSIHFNEKKYSLNENPEVEILNQTTGKATKVTNDSNGGEVSVRNKVPGYYATGGYSTLVFKPNNDFQIESNTKYTITVKGILKDNQPFTYQYSTRIVDVDNTYQSNSIPVNGIDVTSQNKWAMKVGEKRELGIKVYPENGTLGKVDWKSNDNSLATVDSNGVVTARGEGIVQISAETANVRKSIAFIHIEKPTGKTISTAKTIQLGKTYFETNKSGIDYLALPIEKNELGYIVTVQREDKKTVAPVELVASNSNKSATSKGDERFGQRTRKTLEAADYYYFDVSELPNDLTNLIIPIKEIGSYKVMVSKYTSEYSEYEQYLGLFKSAQSKDYFNWIINTNVNDITEKWIAGGEYVMPTFPDVSQPPLEPEEPVGYGDISINMLEKKYFSFDYYKNDMLIKEEGKIKYFDVNKNGLQFNSKNKLIPGQSKLILKNLITNKELVQEVNAVEELVNYPTRLEIIGPESGKLKVGETFTFNVKNYPENTIWDGDMDIVSNGKNIGWSYDGKPVTITVNNKGTMEISVKNKGGRTSVLNVTVE